jgi:hypothetical protein
VLYGSQFDELAVLKPTGGEWMAYKNSRDIKVGDVIYVGIGNTEGRVIKFKPHPKLSEINPGVTGRVAITDRGSITLIDDVVIRTP